MRATLLWWLGDKFKYGLPHGWQSWLRRWTVDSFFPSRCFETEFFFQLLMSLLANPSRLDGCRQGAQVGLRRQVGEI